MDALKRAGFTARVDWILSAEMPDVPGGLLNSVVEPLAGAGVNIKYFYAYSERSANAKAIFVVKTDDLDKAEAILTRLS
jgi:hypothetical protein